MDSDSYGAKSKILDPFIGSGTTELAAKELGLECDGIDIRNWND